MTVTHVFFDIGGVLGTNGWDREQRAAVASELSLDLADLDRRHKEVVASWEEGRMGWDEYLDFTVFHEPRGFTREEFKDRMLALSEPFPDSIAAVAELAARGARVYTLNNESAELNAYRIERFGLKPLVRGFLSSCWLGVRKPERRIYERALAIAGATPAASLFVDDREQNLTPARALGMRGLRFTDASALRSALADVAGASSPTPSR